MSKADTTQGLDEIFNDDYFDVKVAKQAILDWRNKQVEEVLDRLEAEMNRFTSKHDIPMRDEALSAIEAERLAVSQGSSSAERKRLKGE